VNTAYDPKGVKLLSSSHQNQPQLLWFSYDPYLPIHKRTDRSLTHKHLDPEKVNTVYRSYSAATGSEANKGELGEFGQMGLLSGSYRGISGEGNVFFELESFAFELILVFFFIFVKPLNSSFFHP